MFVESYQPNCKCINDLLLFSIQVFDPEECCIMFISDLPPQDYWLQVLNQGSSGSLKVLTIPMGSPSVVARFDIENILYFC